MFEGPKKFKDLDEDEEEEDENEKGGIPEGFQVVEGDENSGDALPPLPEEDEEDVKKAEKWLRKLSSE